MRDRLPSAWTTILTGFQPANLIILAARPSMGKTAFALNLARNVAVDQSKGVALFSLEMSKEELVQRMMCSEARVDSQRLRHGQLAGAEWSKLTGGLHPAVHGAHLHRRYRRRQPDGDPRQGAGGSRPARRTWAWS